MLKDAKRRRFLGVLRRVLYVQNMKCDFCENDAVDISLEITDELTGKTSGDGKLRCDFHYDKWLRLTVRRRNAYLRNHPEEVEKPKKRRRWTESSWKDGAPLD